MTATPSRLATCWSGWTSSGLRSERAVFRDQLREHVARIARLIAESTGEMSIEFPDELTSAASYSPEAQRMIDGQRELFEARNISLQRTDEQLGEQITQIENQIRGLEAQHAALSEQKDLVTADLERLNSLLDQGLVQRTQVTVQQRELADLNGEIGRIEAETAQSRGEIAALNIERLMLDTTRREEAIGELRDLRASELEIRERLRSLDETIDRLDIRAPMSGVIHGNTVFAVKSVVQAGDPMMYIIPQDQPLVVAVRLQPINIDQVLVGQSAGLRFTAFDQRQTQYVATSRQMASAGTLVRLRTRPRPITNFITNHEQIAKPPDPQHQGQVNRHRR